MNFLYTFHQIDPLLCSRVDLESRLLDTIFLNKEHLNNDQINCILDLYDLSIVL